MKIEDLIPKKNAEDDPHYDAYDNHKKVISSSGVSSTSSNRGTMLKGLKAALQSKVDKYKSAKEKWQFCVSKANKDGIETDFVTKIKAPENTLRRSIDDKSLRLKKAQTSTGNRFSQEIKTKDLNVGDSSEFVVTPTAVKKVEELK